MALHTSKTTGEIFQGTWQGVPERSGIQFERLSFHENGSIVACLSTFCPQGLCLSVVTQGSYVVTAEGTLVLTLENISQEFAFSLEDDRLTLREPTGGHPKVYTRVDPGDPG